MKNPEMDYSDIKGQFAAKRATMIAVAGMHNIMYMGPPGSGKTMMAKRIPTIMPEMTFDEKLAVTNIYSVAGQLGDNGGLMEDRPFRAPYHNVTKGAFFGGGIVPRPGEITLAGKGVLFLDEMTEFKPDILEGLRQPLEDKNITIVRMNRAYTYPADFMLVGAMNPCKCGYFPDRNRCNCSEQDIKRFMGKISMPLWDRFDMCIKTEEIGYSELGNKIHQNDGKSTLSIPASFAEHTQGSTPLTPLMLPSRLNSPKIIILSRLTSSIYPFADKIANAIGKSNPVPHFLISAGDILTAILCGGNS